MQIAGSGGDIISTRHGTLRLVVPAPCWRMRMLDAAFTDRRGASPSASPFPKPSLVVHAKAVGGDLVDMDRHTVLYVDTFPMNPNGNMWSRRLCFCINSRRVGTCLRIRRCGSFRLIPCRSTKSPFSLVVTVDDLTFAQFDQDVVRGGRRHPRLEVMHTAPGVPCAQLWCCDVCSLTRRPDREKVENCRQRLTK